MIWHPVRRLGERRLTSVTRACAIPSVVGSVNTVAVVIHGKYRSSEVNKSIVYRLSIEMFIDELRQNVGSVNMIKRGDRFDR